jgi:hypothetical protein
MIKITVRKEGERTFAAYVDDKNMRRIGESRGEAVGKVVSDLIEQRSVRLEDRQVHQIEIKQK